jgi:peptidoglycan/xylan/chitin deacetylase (PgdA/CDA1 family)
MLAPLLHSTGVLRRFHRRSLPGAVTVVTYHGLLQAPLSAPDSCFLQLRHFTEQMEYLARHFQVLHIEEAFGPDPHPTDRPVACVTFDDGFASAHDLALPVLERFSIPATMFVVTGLIDSANTVWSARLHQAVCATAAPEVTFAGRRYPLGSPAARSATSTRLQHALKTLPEPAFDAALDGLVARLEARGAGPAATWEPFRMLRSDQIRQMSRRGLVRVGAHSASHQILTRTTRSGACGQIHASLRAIAALVDRPSRTFAYPNGGPDDFDENVIETLRGAGIQHAVTMIPGPNGRTTDAYRLRRYAVGPDGSIARFAWLVHHAAFAIRSCV